MGWETGPSAKRPTSGSPLKPGDVFMSVHKYESVHDFMDATMAPNKGRSQSGWERFTMGRESYEWLGLPGGKGIPGKKLRDGTAQSLIDCINTGWAEGADKIDTCMDRVQAAPVVGVKRRQTWCDDGDDVDMDRVRGGNLDIAWRRARRSAALVPPRIVVAVDCIAGGWIDAEEMFWKGAAAVRLAETLCIAGYTVTVVSGFTGTSRKTHTVLVTVKPAGRHFDLATAAAAMALPSFFRMLGHAHGANFIGNQGGYSIQNLTAATVQEIDPDARVFVAGQTGIEDKAKAEAWVKAQVAALEDVALAA